MKRSLCCLSCFLLIGVAVVSAGCSGAEKRLIGSWQTEKQGVPMGVEFKEDKTMAMSIGPLSTPGTWRVIKAEGDKMTIKVAMEEIALPKIGFDETEAETEKQEQEFAIEFESNDRMKMAPTDDPSDSLTFDRKKS